MRLMMDDVGESMELPRLNHDFPAWSPISRIARLKTLCALSDLYFLVGDRGAGGWNIRSRED
jgi:hypothetical protein